MHRIEKTKAWLIFGEFHETVAARHIQGGSKKWGHVLLLLISLKMWLTLWSLAPA